MTLLGKGVFADPVKGLSMRSSQITQMASQSDSKFSYAKRQRLPGMRPGDGGRDWSHESVGTIDTVQFLNKNCEL